MNYTHYRQNYVTFIENIPMLKTLHFLQFGLWQQTAKTILYFTCKNSLPAPNYLVLAPDMYAKMNHSKHRHIHYNTLNKKRYLISFPKPATELKNELMSLWYIHTYDDVLYTVYCVLYTVYWVLYTVYCVWCTVYCVLYTVYCVLGTVYWVLCTVYCILCMVYCILCTV